MKKPSFTNKQKLRKFSITKPALQQMLKGLLQAGNTKRRGLQKPSPKNKVNGNRIPIITLNVNWLNPPTKRHRLAEWIRKQDPYISVQKKPTSDLGMLTD